MSCPCWHVLTYLSPCLHVPIYLSSLSCPGWPVRPTCPQWAGAAILSLRSCVLPRLSFSGCPVLKVLSFVVFPISTIQTVLSCCPVPAVLSQRSFFGCPVPAVLSRLTCLSCPVPAALYWLPLLTCTICPITAILTSMHFPSCPVLAFQKTGSLVLLSCWLPWPVLEKFIWRINSNERKLNFYFKIKVGSWSLEDPIVRMKAKMVIISVTLCKLFSQKAEMNFCKNFAKTRKRNFFVATLLTVPSNR